MILELIQRDRLLALASEFDGFKQICQFQIRQEVSLHEFLSAHGASRETVVIFRHLLQLNLPGSLVGLNALNVGVQAIQTKEMRAPPQLGGLAFSLVPLGHILSSHYLLAYGALVGVKLRLFREHFDFLTFLSSSVPLPHDFLQFF